MASADENMPDVPITGSPSAANVEERATKRLKTDQPTSAVENGHTEDAGKANGVQKAPQGLAEEAAKSNGVHDAPNGDAAAQPSSETNKENERPRGQAPIKKEYLTPVSGSRDPADIIDDDAAEGKADQVNRGRDDRDSGKQQGKKDKKKNRGQNTERTFGHFADAIRLCNSRAFYPEFSPRECRFGDNCKLCHDLRKYMAEGRRDNLDTLGGKCHVFEQYGRCPSGWKCRFVSSHHREVEHEDGRKELVLIEDEDKIKEAYAKSVTGPPAEDSKEENEDQRPGIYNVVDYTTKIDLNRKRVDFSKSDKYIKWLNDEAKTSESVHNSRRRDTVDKDNKAEAGDEQPENNDAEDRRAQYVEPPFLPSEKRRLYFGPETPALAPLTTQGNLPFRRICVDLGAQLTYSEMAMGFPLVQGTKADWTLMKAHEDEVAPPRVNPNVVLDSSAYDNAKDLRFGAQISANAPWVAVKAADALSRFCPRLRLIDLNCGCPIDMLYKAGAGAALLESHGKLERMVRGMNAVSGEVPVTAKIRTGIRGSRPTAPQVISKLAFGAREHRDRLGAPGCAAITLHGRSREQRYTKRADWEYISECAALVKTYNEQKASLTDTAAEPDPRTLPNAKDGRLFFLGNGDCYSHVEHQEHIDKARVDSVMIGRGALIKPWLFEEIEKGQYLDKSATERLVYVEKFVRYGLEAWGSDELGIGFTRRFLLEWLSFAHRYIPIGLLEHLPPNLNDRPPRYHGRNDLETLMASTNFQDWIKISEMFLGPVHPGFKFQPKHKSNAYEAEG